MIQRTTRRGFGGAGAVGGVVDDQAHQEEAEEGGEDDGNVLCGQSGGGDHSDDGGDPERQNPVWTPRLTWVIAMTPGTVTAPDASMTDVRQDLVAARVNAVTM
jgi:hypothetical protein